MLPLVLALMSVPAPRECPWTTGEFRLLLPNGGTIPRNASFWVHTYDDGEYVVEEASSASVAVDRVELELTSTGGKLIELRPRALLASDAEYVFRPTWQLQGEMVTTTSTTDETPPSMPVVQSIQPIASAYDVCQTAGFVIYLEVPGEAVINLVEAVSDGSIIEAASGVDRIVIPAEPNATITFRLRAMDLAGNLSEATAPMTTVAGDVPGLNAGKARDPDFAGDGGPFGCACQQASERSLGWLLALLSLLSLARLRSFV